MINYTTAAEAAKLIKSNDSVYIQGSVSIPEVLVKAMADRGHELRGVKVYSAFAIGREEAPYCKPEYKDSFLVYSLFVSNSVRNWIAQGYGQAIPAFLGEIPGLFRKGIIPIDVALLNCSRPNADGYCSFGTSADLAVSAAECAKVVIAQINPHVPFSYGDALIHVSKLTAAVEVDEPLVELPTAQPSEIDRKIGGYIAAGILDVGITGLDWLTEGGHEDKVMHVADLVYSKTSNRPCRWVLAVAGDSPYQCPQDLAGKRIATELEGLTRNYFKRVGVDVNVFYSWGATEAKVVEGLADGIVEVTETGTTIRAHGLRIIDEVMCSYPVIIANKEAWADPRKRDRKARPSAEAAECKRNNALLGWYCIAS